MMGNGFGFGFGGGFMWIFWLLLLLGVIWALKAVITDRPDRGEPRDAPKTALQILEERYARGEIGREEFQRAKSDLQH